MDGHKGARPVLFAVALIVSCGGTKPSRQEPAGMIEDASVAWDVAGHPDTTALVTGADVAAPLPADTALPADGASTPDLFAAPDGPSPAGMPAVRLVARVDRSKPDAPRFAWSGSTILARFTGSSIGVHLAGPTNYFDVRVDGMLLP